MVRTPKFIDTPETFKAVYSWRIEEAKLNKLHELANLTNTNTPDLLNNIIDSYLEDRIVYNSYLESYKNYFIKLPIDLDIKEYLIERSLFNLLKNNDYKQYNQIFKFIKSKEDLEDIDLTFNNYKIQRIPNNLDIFNSSDLSYYTNIIEDFKTHNGLEFYIEPDIAVLTKDYTNCLYCFYFSVLKHGVEINIISYNDAIDFLKKSNNKELLAIAESIYTKLANAKNIRSVNKIAREWNTNNIIKLEDIEEDGVKPYKIEINKDNTIIKPYDKDMEDNIKELKLQVKEQTSINKVLVKELEDLKKENNELKETNEEIINKLDTAVANAIEDTKEEAKEIVKDILKEYGF